MAAIVTTASRPKLAALDTNILFHLAEQYAPAHNLVLRLVRTGFMPVVVQTVVQELSDAVKNGDTQKKRESAAIALSSMVSGNAGTG
jgi:rRNA-processing protein FCF1